MSDGKDTGTGTTKAAKEILEDNLGEPGGIRKTIDEAKLGHAMKKAGNFTATALGVLGGVFAIGSGIAMYRNRNKLKEEIHYEVEREVGVQTGGGAAGRGGRAGR